MLLTRSSKNVESGRPLRVPGRSTSLRTRSFGPTAMRRKRARMGGDRLEGAASTKQEPRHRSDLSSGLRTKRESCSS